MASHLVAALCLAALLLGSCFGAPTIRTTVGNTGQQQPNSDVLARLQDRVSISCMDDSRVGSIRVNGVAKGQDGQLIIDSMSVEDQGRYQCCVDGVCQEIAIITIPPNNNTEVVVAVGERAALRCPLEFMKEFGRFYRAVWRVPVDRTIATTNPEQLLESWAQLDNNTLTLTVGPFNSTLPKMFACVLLSFNRLNSIDFGTAAIGTVNINLASTQNLTVRISPPVITSGSSEQFMITCQTEMGQVLYRPSYQFFFNGSPIGAPSNSSYVMVNATSSGNFTCNATQYSDQGTAIPSPQSAPVESIVLDAPRLGPPADQDNDCNQEVTVTLQQPIPDEMYYAFSKTTESCTGLGQTYSVNITTGESRLEFTVNVGESGLDTRQEVYLVSWYTMNGVMGPCSNELMNPTEEACPPSPPSTPLPVAIIVAATVGSVLVLIVITILLTARIVYGVYKRRNDRRGVINASRLNPEDRKESRECCC